jgi:hypothetical protein
MNRIIASIDEIEEFSYSNLNDCTASQDFIKLIEPLHKALFVWRHCKGFQSINALKLFGFENLYNKNSWRRACSTYLRDDHFLNVGRSSRPLLLSDTDIENIATEWNLDPSDSKQAFNSLVFPFPIFFFYFFFYFFFCI